MQQRNTRFPRSKHTILPAVRTVRRTRGTRPMDMDKRIDLEKRGRSPDQITELNLDNCRSTQISGLTDEFTNLKSLSLINVGLTTLKGFPNLPSLRKLELGDNRLSGGLNFLHGCPKLSYLNLGGNKFKDIESLQPLKELKELRTLDLFNCEVTNLDSYRESTFELLTDLRYLDGFDRNEQEAEEDEDEGEDDGSEVSGENGDEVVDVDDEDEDDEDDDDEDGDEDGEEVGLNYLTKPLDNESDGGEFEPGDEEDDDDDDLDDENDEEVEPERGTKRKREQDEADEDEKDD